MPFFDLVIVKVIPVEGDSNVYTITQMRKSSKKDCVLLEARADGYSNIEAKNRHQHLCSICFYEIRPINPIRTWITNTKNPPTCTNTPHEHIKDIMRREIIKAKTHKPVNFGFKPDKSYLKLVKS